MNVCIMVAGLAPHHRARLSAALQPHAVTFGCALAEPERRAALAEAEIVFGNVPAGWLDAAPRLRWVQLDSAGVDAYLQINRVARPAPVQLTNLAGFYDRAVAEAALAGILAYYRCLPALLAAQPAARLIKPEVEPGFRSLAGESVLVLGAGAIGRRIAAVLAACDARVQCFARSRRAGMLAGLPELDAALATTDLLVNTLPHTPETNGLLDAARLARLKRDAVVCNVGRGSAIDETALVGLLDAGHLGGAVLDVTAIEPLPGDSPLWRHPRVLLTHHTGGRFRGEIDRKLDVFLDNFARFTRRAPLVNAVDCARGY